MGGNMVVKGSLTMSIGMNVVDLETYSVEVNKHGEISIFSPEQFFMDWVDEWNMGNGELLGAVDEDKNLSVEESEY